MKKIYLDNSATTRLDPRVLRVMVQELESEPLNPSSSHSYGQKARRLLREARESTATFFGVAPEEVFFTSGGTEAINTFLRGLPRGHILTSSVEHSSIDKTVRSLEKEGWSATFVPVSSWGAPSPEAIAAALRPDTVAIVLSAANGETGVKLDIPKVASIAESARVPLFLDAIALVGKERLTLPRSVIGIAVSAHKFHGPKGVGALVLRSHAMKKPLFTGGMQEFSQRAGTENLAGILGMAEALKIVAEQQDQITHHLYTLQRKFEERLQARFPSLQINGDGPRAPHVSNVAFPGCDGETLLIHLDLLGIAASHGSACSSGALEPSRVLMNMGYAKPRARSSIRFSFSRDLTLEEIEEAVTQICNLCSGAIPGCRPTESELKGS
jgi:cysteine desulfurase